jgi:FkbM family methyltransferase
MEIVIKEHTLFSELFNDELVIIDLGACRGEFIEKINEMFNVKKAILVEANPTNYSKLIRRNNYILYNNAISDINGSSIIFYEDEKSPYNGSYVFNYFSGKPHDIKTITLEQIFIDNNIDYVDILKVDIEGAEYDLLNSISDEIYSKIKQLTIEFHDFIDSSYKQKTNDIIRKLNSLGFKHKSKPINYMNNSENYDVIFYR